MKFLKLNIKNIILIFNKKLIINLNIKYLKIELKIFSFKMFYLSII